MSKANGKFASDLQKVESQHTLNDRQLDDDQNPYSEKQQTDLRSSTGDLNKRVIDKNVFYQFTHGSHPDLHSNVNMAGSRSDLASVVNAGHAPTATPNTMAINEGNLSRQSKSKVVNTFYQTGNAFSSSGQKVVHFQDSSKTVIKDRIESTEPHSAQANLIMENQNVEYQVESNFKTTSEAIMGKSAISTSKFESNTRAIPQKKKGFFLVDDNTDKTAKIVGDKVMRQTDKQVLLNSNHSAGIPVGKYIVQPQRSVVSSNGQKIVIKQPSKGTKNNIRLFTSGQRNLSPNNNQYNRPVSQLILENQKKLSKQQWMNSQGSASQLHTVDENDTPTQINNSTLKQTKYP